MLLISGHLLEARRLCSFKGWKSINFHLIYWNFNINCLPHHNYHHSCHIQVSINLFLLKLKKCIIMSMIITFQGNSSKGHIKVPHSAVPFHPPNVDYCSGVCGLKHWRYSLWRLYDGVCVPALLHTGCCDVDGSWGTANVPETGHRFCHNYDQVHRSCFNCLLVWVF